MDDTKDVTTLPGVLCDDAGDQNGDNGVMGVNGVDGVEDTQDIGVSGVEGRSELKFVVVDDLLVASFGQDLS